MSTEAQRALSVKFAGVMFPIEEAHDKVVAGLKAINNTILFQCKDEKLNRKLRKSIELLEANHYKEIQLTTRALRSHYLE